MYDDDGNCYFEEDIDVEKSKSLVKGKTLECKIEEITLLSYEEFKKYKSVIPNINAWFWLRSPAFNSKYASSIFSRNGISDYVYGLSDKEGCVRPALRLNTFDSSELQPRDKVQLFGLDWTVLNITKNQIYILADNIVAQRRFDSTRRKWESSELKAWLEEDWFPKALVKNNYDPDPTKNTIVLTPRKDSDLSTKFNAKNEIEKEAESDWELE